MHVRWQLSPAALCDACHAFHPYPFIGLQVVVPPTFFDYTSRRVLTTGWLEGEKLSQSQASDVGTLVSVSGSGSVWGGKEAASDAGMCAL